jgi:hypothetical protein
LDKPTTKETIRGEEWKKKAYKNKNKNKIKTWCHKVMTVGLLPDKSIPKTVIREARLIRRPVRILAIDYPVKVYAIEYPIKQAITYRVLDNECTTHHTFVCDFNTKTVYDGLHNIPKQSTLTTMPSLTPDDTGDAPSTTTPSSPVGDAASIALSTRVVDILLKHDLSKSGSTPVSTNELQELIMSLTKAGQYYNKACRCGIKQIRHKCKIDMNTLIVDFKKNYKSDDPFYDEANVIDSIIQVKPTLNATNTCTIQPCENKPVEKTREVNTPTQSLSFANEMFKVANDVLKVLVRENEALVN